MIQPYYKAPHIVRLHRSGELSVVVQYLITGALTSMTDYAVFFALFYILQAGLLPATVAAYIAGLLVSFLLSRFWVFKKHATGQRVMTSAWRYVTLLAVNLAITYLMLWTMETWFALTPLLGKFVVWFFMIFWIYAANRLWVFKGPRQVRKSILWA
jgi:putative flippase GtrA